MRPARHGTGSTPPTRSSAASKSAASFQVRTLVRFKGRSESGQGTPPLPHFFCAPANDKTPTHEAPRDRALGARRRGLRGGAGFRAGTTLAPLRRGGGGGGDDRRDRRLVRGRRPV